MSPTNLYADDKIGDANVFVQTVNGTPPDVNEHVKRLTRLCSVLSRLVNSEVSSTDD